MKVIAFSIVFGLLVIPSIYSSVPTSDLCPYGKANGDAQLPIGRGNFVNVELKLGKAFKLYNSSYNSVFVNTDGAISFTKGKLCKDRIPWRIFIK